MKKLFLIFLIFLILIFGLSSCDGLYKNVKNDSSSKSTSHLQISDGSIFIPKDSYPKFTFDVTPTYNQFSDHNLLSSDQVQFIADRTSFLCIEKAHGILQGYKNSSEDATGHEVRAFHKVKTDLKALFYFNSVFVWTDTSYNNAFKPGEIDNHPYLRSLLIRDPNTDEPYLCDRRKTYHFDVLNPELRKWWVNTVSKGVADSGAHGAFIDQMHGAAFLRPRKVNEIAVAMGEMMEALKVKLGPDKIILANNAYMNNARYVIDHVDAVMFEHYTHKIMTKEKLFEDWKQMEQIAKSNKITVWRIGVDHDVNRPENNEDLPQFADEMLEFYLACFLIGAQPYSYFQYGWGWRLSTGPLRDFPLLKKPLGPPLGAYKRTSPDGWEFTREFKKASVRVNTETREASITWH